MTLYTAHTGIKPYYFPCQTRLFHAPLSHPPSTPTPTHTHYPRPQLGLPHTPGDEWVSGGEGGKGSAREVSVYTLSHQQQHWIGRYYVTLTPNSSASPACPLPRVTCTWTTIVDQSDVAFYFLPCYVPLCDWLGSTYAPPTDPLSLTPVLLEVKKGEEGGGGRVLPNLTFLHLLDV